MLQRSLSATARLNAATAAPPPLALQGIHRSSSTNSSGVASLGLNAGGGNSGLCSWGSGSLKKRGSVGGGSKPLKMMKVGPMGLTIKEVCLGERGEQAPQIDEDRPQGVSN